ncbi:hypothetical protein K1T71_008437 [Dendrolimus kikuchii]|uniref:Uncharacterized protein n=1 Tax=Dendrolimus kikuchii TaxID=765133 RepID=A0ACC1CY38_9NEOP|nr:hypothetical protein K1T71_008437 [Dendrolimus kikuchii]
MEKPFEYVKSLVLCYKLETCCCVAPIRIGLIFTGYFNALMAIICLEATANESFPPTIVKVQEMILEDNATKSIPILAYCMELGFSFVLLCAIYRSDLDLMQIYMYYCMAAIVMSLLVYSIVIAAIDVLIQIAIILSTGFQVYVLLLVRSAMVEIKLSRKNIEVPTLVMSSLIQKEERKEEVEAKQTDTEIPEKEEEDETKTVPDIKVETVEEKPKEETASKSRSIFKKFKPNK